MAEQEDIATMTAPDQEGQQPTPQPPDKVAQYYDYLKKAGADVAPTLDSFKRTLSNDSTARQYYGYLRDHHFDAPPDYGSFARTLGVTAASAPATPEHLISHTPVQDARHLYDLANQPMRYNELVTGPYASGKGAPYPEDLARNQQFQKQYEQNVSQLATNWGTDPKATQQAFQDFPGETDESRLKNYATLNKTNPINYGRLKDANDIRTAIAQSGHPDSFSDANTINTLFAPRASDSYDQLQHNVAMAQEIMSKHGLGQPYAEKLKNVYGPLINTLQPGLLVQYWNSDDQKLGLSEFQYAGLETEKLFQPDKYKQDVAILRHNKGLDEAGGGETTPPTKKGYAYDRGVENVLFSLENQGRQNTGKYINQRSAELDPAMEKLTADYKQRIAAAPDDASKQALYQEYQNLPQVKAFTQESQKLAEGQQSIEYAQSEDQRRFPLNYGDQATRLVKDAMSSTNGYMGVAGKQVLLGAGETADNTMRFIKNTYINLLGSDAAKAENAAKNIGHQALTELSGYEGSEYSMQQPSLLIDPGLVQKVQATFSNPQLSTEEKNQQATDLIRNNQGAIKVNANAGQQNLTGKAFVYSAANTIGQILGIADQSLLMGGLLGDAAKAQQMANAFVPMYASTQNQLYEQALARGDEKPLLRSHLDATILSLASMINPDIKIVKGMVGAETGVGKLIAGVDESTWNAVLSRNKPLMDRMIAGTKATARQLGLANLQYGLLVPGAQYLVHKNILNEDPNLGDAIKDGLLQTNISMALPALLHGAFGYLKAGNVNPMQKYALVEMGVHPKENIELIDQAVEKGQITPDRADQLKEIIKHADHILESHDGVKSDGTPMTEQEVADTTWSLLRKKVLEGKLKTAPEPQKPALEQALHDVNQDISELHTAPEHQHKVELNRLLTENLGRIQEQAPAMEEKIREAIRRNEPETIFRDIYEQASETKTVEGKEVSSRGEAEAVFGKALVAKALELHATPPPEVAAAEPLRPEVEAPPNEVPIQKAPATGGGSAASIQPVSDRIRPTDVFRTWFLGDMEGKPEDEAAKKHLEGVVRDWDRHPAGETGGETFGSFVRRVIPAFKNVLETAANNTAIVTHSSVLKAMRVWEEMGRPDVDNLTAEQKKEFADKYNAAETHNGDLETFKGTNGDIHVIRHGQTEDNAKNNFRSGNTNLTEKGVQDAQAVGQQLRSITGGDVPALISSDLPRTIHSSNIIHDALQIGSPAGVLQRTPEGIGETGGERGGMEPGQQGQGPAGQGGGAQEGQAPPGAGGTPIDPDEWPFREEPFDTPAGIKKVISESVRTQWNLPEIEFSALPPDDVILRQGKTAVDQGLIHPQEVALRVAEQGGIYTPEEGGAMQYYAWQLRKAESDLRQEQHEADELLQKDPDNTAAFYAKLTAEQRLGQLDDEIDLKTKADRTNSNSWGKLGNIMQIETDEGFSPSRVRSIVKDNYGGEIPKEVQARLDKAMEERDQAIADMKKAKEKVAEAALEKDAKKETSSKVAKTIQEKKAALKEEREKLIEALKAALKKDAGNLGANPLPIHTIEAVSKLALNYFKDGVLSVEAISKKIYQDLKEVVPGIELNQIREAVASYQPLVRSQATERELKQAAGKEVELGRLAARREKTPETAYEGPEKKPKVIFEQDTDYIKAHQRLVRSEYKIKQEKQKSYDAQQSRLQKTMGWANRLMRLSILSGVKVLEKLAAAATIGSATMKPLEEVLNGIWGTAFKKVAAKADIDMGMNVRAIGKYYSHFFDPVQFVKDAKDIVQKGETQLGMELENQHFDHVPVLDLPTDLHQVIKTPPKRGMFQYALTKILAHQQGNGIDINHPLVLESARQRAFARAKYEIFMEDNAVSRMFGKWEANWKDQGTAGAAKSFLLHFAFPVSKVPTNIARRIGLSTVGLPMGLYKAAQAYRGGIENLTTDEANAIGRALTKGSIGIGLWMAGFFGYKSMGGLYTKFDPNKQRKYNEPKSDEMNLFGLDIPKPAQHALPFEIMQLGATYRHIYEKTKTDSKSDPIAVAKATMGSAGSILEQIPVVETPIHAVMATQDPYESKKLGEDVKRRFEPQGLKDIGVIQGEKKGATTRRQGGNE